MGPAVAAPAVAIAYFLAARLSLLLLAEPDGVAVFWPAAGVASGILIGAGAAARWPVVIGVAGATLVANLLGDRNLPSSLFFAVANALEALVIAGLVWRFHGSPFTLTHVQRVVGLFVAAVVGTVISGAIGTLGFVLFHASTASIPTIWLHWVAADALGIITVAPLAIGLASLIRDPPPRRELTEAALALTVAAVLCAGMVFLPNQPWTFELAIAAMSPLVVWIAARLRPAFTAIATFMFAITIVWTTIFAVGVFGDARLPVEERILSAQATILAASFGALVLAALFSERRLHESAILEREHRLQGALRAGGVMTFDWNIAADQVRHSQNVEQILGVQPGQPLDSKTWLEQIHPDDRSQVMECLHRARPDAPSHAVTFRYQRPHGNGEEVWLEQIAVTQFDAAGNPAHIHGLTTDITARKQSEQEISKAQKSAELANRAKSSFLAAASHDLRQPLQTLRVLQGSLEQQALRGEGRKLVADMGRSLETMSSILSSLLDVNQLESGTLRPSISEFALNDILDSIAADFARPVEESGLRWRLVRSGVMVRSDKRMLEEMLRNLLSNAIRYTDGGTIVLGCRRHADKVRIEVWDSGVGMTEDQLPHIFEEYYQGTEGEQRGGFGLGLAIVKRLAHLLDHRIDVRSVPGKGTRISVEAPLVQSRNDQPQQQWSSVNDVALLARNVLIIEDETSVRTAVVRFLKAKGIGMVVTATVDDALTLINQQGIRPDLLLSDYNLRGSVDGVEGIKALRAALGWNVPAIVMTGDIRSKTLEAIAASDILVLIKPFLVNELLQLMTRPHQARDA